ncbi:MAG: DUF262 domain-containing protein [Anaerolineales bacterium]|nr:DUF262 domain-containing protein [Anaerolineales bacterium]
MDAVVTTNDIEIDEETTGDDLTNVPYDPAQVKVDYKPFSIFQVMRKIRLGEIDLHPDFQRRLVWDKTRQSRLVESILINIPLPAFYLDATTLNRWVVVDGLQRLSTLDRFCNQNEFTLQNLEFLKDLEGKTFDELPRNYQQQIEETHLNLYIIQPDVPDEVKFTIFYRINTGGIVLTRQEIRHCLFHGPATDFLKKLAEAQKFKIVTTNSIPTKHMDDRECILRFFAFYLTPYTDYQQSNFDAFLAQTMRRLNAMDDTERRELRERLFEMLNRARAVFGPYAFRKIYEVDGKRYPINKSLFEVWAVTLLNHDPDRLTERKDEIIRRFVQIMNEDDEFNKAISTSTGSIKSVHKRFSAIEALLAEVMA